MNYTKPNDENYEDKPEDWLLTSLIFTRAISFLLPENHGIVVDLKGDAIKLYPDAKRVIVGHSDRQVYLEPADERTDLNEGDWVEIIRPENIQN
jgi:hypothetical protein